MRKGLLLIGLLSGIGSMAPAAPSDLTLKGPITQGSLLIGHIFPGAHVQYGGRAIATDPDGVFVIAIGRDATGDLPLAIDLPGGAKIRPNLPIAARQWAIERINGLPPSIVMPDPRMLARIHADHQQLVALRQIDTPYDGFRAALIWPVLGRISGVFGSQRILNGQPRAPHLGLDVAAPLGTFLMAPLPGHVMLAGQMALTGNTLVVDHGHGVSSVFAHLQTILVKPGDSVDQGQRIARIGMTGRATGPHVHWGLYWFDTAVDPALLLPPMPPFSGQTTGPPGGD